MSEISLSSRIFISWSGETSKLVAGVLRDYMEVIIPGSTPFMSDEDIETSEEWSKVLSEKLESTHVGLIVLTPDNLSSTWLHFEAGALSKNTGLRRLHSLLFCVNESDFTKSPLRQFQYLKYDTSNGRDTTLKLYLGLHKAIKGKLDAQISEKLVERLFDQFWPEVSTKLINISERVREKREPDESDPGGERSNKYEIAIEQLLNDGSSIRMRLDKILEVITGIESATMLGKARSNESRERLLPENMRKLVEEIREMKS